MDMQCIQFHLPFTPYIHLYMYAMHSKLIQTKITENNLINRERKRVKMFSPSHDFHLLHAKQIIH